MSRSGALKALQLEGIAQCKHLSSDSSLRNAAFFPPATGGNKFKCEVNYKKSRLVKNIDNVSLLYPN